MFYVSCRVFQRTASFLSEDVVNMRLFARHVIFTRPVRERLLPRVPQDTQGRGKDVLPRADIALARIGQ